MMNLTLTEFFSLLSLFRKKMAYEIILLSVHVYPLYRFMATAR
jgi:hypothetical protein